MSRLEGNVHDPSGSRSLKAVNTRLVLVCMDGQIPLRPLSPAHWPPSTGLRSKTVGSKPWDISQRAVTRPPGPAPITATSRVIDGLSHDSACGAVDSDDQSPDRN